MTPDEVDRVRSIAVLGEWQTQLAGGHLTLPGLEAIRHRLRSGELDARPDAEAMLMRVVEAIMLARGLSSWHVLDEVSPPTPDTPGEMFDLPDVGE